MPAFSHSRIGTFETCKLQFKYKYVDKIKTEQEHTAETFLGSLVHETLEKLYKALQFEKLLTKEELIAWYNEEWEKRWNDTILIVRTEYSQDNYRNMGERFITDYYDHYTPFNQTRTIGLETEKMMDLGDGYSYHIRIDRLSDAGDGVYEIHDYKTNSSLPDQEKLDGDRQLAMYAAWVKQEFSDAKKVRLIWHFLAFNKEMSSERTDLQLEELKKEVLSHIHAIEKESEWKPTQTALCSWCAYQNICPLWKHKFMVEELPHYSDDDGALFVDKLQDLRDQEKDIQEKIQTVQAKIYQYGEQKGVTAVFGSVGKATIWQKECVKFPGKKDPLRDDFIHVLKAKGLFDKFADIDTWALEREYDSLSPEEKKLLEPFSRKEAIRRIYLRKT